MIERKDAMEQDKTGNTLSKEAMKTLRAERKQWIDMASANVREHKKAFKAIRNRLSESNATVPEIAEAAGLKPDKTLWLVASMKKFGEIVEIEKDGDFYRYALAGDATRDA